MPADPRATAAPARIEALDGVRGLAIVAVVAMHATLFTTVHPRVPAEPLAQALQLGWSGVDLFFVLSGFLITGILLRQKDRPHYFRDFYARRALRIFPLYYAVLALLLFVLQRPPTSGAEKASYLLYYQNLAWLCGHDVHPDLARTITWSLAVEEQFYLLWPAVVWLLPRRRLPWLCLGLAAAAIALRAALLARGVDTAYFLTPCRLDALAAGACLAVWPSPPAWIGRAAVLVGIAGLAATAWATGSPLPQDNPGLQLWGLAAALLLAVGLLTLARGEGVVARVCRGRCLRSFGQFSYCIYLVHILVVEWLAARLVAAAEASPALREWLVERSPPLLVLLAFVATSLAAVWVVGWASWHLYERHFLALKRHFGGAAAGPAEPPTAARR
ncbi:MAG: acyltransferase [Planctomycetes bacterium]|nr:acyltransferase [Planctomycetota bacterium]